MSDLKRSGAAPTPATHEEQPKPKGLNLALYFSLIAVALLTAIVIALMIVRPFYINRH